MEKITGKNNDTIKNVKKLLTSSKSRKDQNSFVLEGVRLVFDVLNSFYKTKLFLITEEAYEKNKEKADELKLICENSFFISNDIAQKLSETENSQGVFAVVEKSDNEFNFKGSKYLALDNVQDPGNLGTIIRTADALGIDGVIVGGGCDLYNPKVIRSTMGSILRINAIQVNNLKNFITNAKKDGFTICGTSPSDNSKNICEFDFQNKIISIIGNEANGISREIFELCDEILNIPMNGNAESLNASVAATLIMWEMIR